LATAVYFLPLDADASPVSDIFPSCSNHLRLITVTLLLVLVSRPSSAIYHTLIYWA